MVDPKMLKPLGEAAREDPPKQMRKLVRSIAEFGFVRGLFLSSLNMQGYGPDEKQKLT